jgi:hypothetical protein
MPLSSAAAMSVLRVWSPYCLTDLSPIMLTLYVACAQSRLSCVLTLDDKQIALFRSLPLFSQMLMEGMSELGEGGGARYGALSVMDALSDMHADRTAKVGADKAVQAEVDLELTARIGIGAALMLDWLQTLGHISTFSPQGRHLLLIDDISDRELPLVKAVPNVTDDVLDKVDPSGEMRAAPALSLSLENRWSDETAGRSK